MLICMQERPPSSQEHKSLVMSFVVMRSTTRMFEPVCVCACARYRHTTGFTYTNINKSLHGEHTSIHIRSSGFLWKGSIRTHTCICKHAHIYMHVYVNKCTTMAVRVDGTNRARGQWDNGKRWIYELYDQFRSTVTRRMKIRAVNIFAYIIHSTRRIMTGNLCTIQSNVLAVTSRKQSF